MPPLYDLEAVRPMWEELQHVGISPLTTPEEVDAVLTKGEGTALVVVNSVCGCAAGNCRPGVALALQHTTIPDVLTTVFAGIDHEAVERARSYMPMVPPSSPCIALFKDSKPVFIMQRSHIEQMTAVDIANELRKGFDEFCSAQGPSVPPEVFENHESVKRCGSSIPLYGG